MSGMLEMAGYSPIRFNNDKLLMLDQRSLPNRIEYIEACSVDEVCLAIKDMVVRGAPLIGIVAAFGMYISIYKSKDNKELKKLLIDAYNCLSNTRPTAVNLFFALDRIKGVFKEDASINANIEAIKNEAFAIWEEQKASDIAIGELGSEYLKDKKNILTHCNTGSLATGGIGTALGIIKTMHKKGYLENVFVDETRPYLQGSRLSAFELKQEKIPYKIATDNSCGMLMKKGLVDAVLVGADRIAKNGDTANKIGTFCLAVLAKKHNIPFVVAAPESTIDRTIKSMDDIVVEERDKDEVLNIFGNLIAPKDSDAIHYSFDLTDNELISAIITEKNVYERFEF
jgi:methylthioribose-1-phosphate isomerase